MRENIATSYRSFYTDKQTLAVWCQHTTDRSKQFFHKVFEQKMCLGNMRTQKKANVQELEG
ncbi:MAG TPA: hypothetical protein DCE42_19890 [Myxococcales bacterium]|nr:hypothetical protein [Deltaproteobacteria bacterium]MBU52879.1 hypothetical protein [Deltaproteobacteria bacterium]HAA57038.1 hypothetical protein [Myxococcales bacterium]